MLEKYRLTSVIVAAVLLFLCLCMIALMIFGLVWGSLEGKMNKPESARSFLILYISYRTDGLGLHWESVITVPRMLLAAVGVYSNHRDTNGVQVGFLAMTIFTFFALHDLFQPFREEGMSVGVPNCAGGELWLITPESSRVNWVDFNRSLALHWLERSTLFMAMSLFLVASLHLRQEVRSQRSRYFCLGSAFS